MQTSYFEKKKEKKKNFRDFKFILSDIMSVWIIGSTSWGLNELPYNLFIYLIFGEFGKKKELKEIKKYNKFWIELLDWMNWEIGFPWFVNWFPNFILFVLLIHLLYSQKPRKKPSRFISLMWFNFDKKSGNLLIWLYDPSKTSNLNNCPIISLFSWKKIIFSLNNSLTKKELPIWFGMLEILLKDKFRWVKLIKFWISTGKVSKLLLEILKFSKLVRFPIDSKKITIWIEKRKVF